MCFKDHLCHTWERLGCNNPIFSVFLLSFIFRISWGFWEWRVISNCVWFRGLDLFTLRKRSYESSTNTTALFRKMLLFYAFFHTMLSHGISQQQWGTAELKKLPILWFLGPQIWRSSSNSYKLEVSCVKAALWEQNWGGQPEAKSLSWRHAEVWGCCWGCVMTQF